MEHDEARNLAEVEYQRVVEVLAQLNDDQWRTPTDCQGWDVRAMFGHVLGMMELAADAAEGQRQRKAAVEAAQHTGKSRLDAMTALQVEEHSHLSSQELLAAIRATAPRAIAGRFDTTPEQRAAPYDPGPPFDEPWTLGYLREIILTRDTWLHRIDTCRATGKGLVLTAAHDGRIVADVVAEWGRRHGRPFTLALTGPAGGSFGCGDRAQHFELDAVEFCRILSGRAGGDGLLAQTVPF